MKNKLFYGDNLTVMKKLSNDSIDLIYLDPPFNSKRSYNVMYKTMTGGEVPEQVEAFCDTWEMDAEKQDLLDNMVETMNHYKMDADFVALWDMWIKALRETRRDLTAYLLYMTVRLLEMKRVLKSTGSIYLHCDPTASHYLKALMDGIFGHQNFQNEIVWCYKSGGATKKRFARKHDILLFYSKNKNFLFNYQTEKSYGQTGGGQGGKVKYFKDDKGSYSITGMRDWWNISMLSTTHSERLGYPTQKPIKLLDRIIKASCPEDGIVLDPFCGCGTTIYAAHLNNRKWIGIDIAILSTHLVKRTLFKRYAIKDIEDYIIDGIPVSEEQAKFLWQQDPFQFQNWAVEYVLGFCTSKKTRDGGVDGRLYFKDKDNNLENMIISVKGGKLKAQDVRDLVGTMELEKVAMVGLISFDKPSKDMKKRQIDAGIYKDQYNNKYNKLQFLSVADIIENNARFDVPQKISLKDNKNEPAWKFPVESFDYT